MSWELERSIATSCPARASTTSSPTCRRTRPRSTWTAICSPGSCVVMRVPRRATSSTMRRSSYLARVRALWPFRANADSRRSASMSSAGSIWRKGPASGRSRLTRSVWNGWTGGATAMGHLLGARARGPARPSLTVADGSVVPLAGRDMTRHVVARAVERTLTGWARNPVTRAAVYRPEHRREVGELVRALAGRHVLARGRGTAYGDAALNDREAVLHTVRLSRFLDFDAETGRLTCEAGVPLRAIA